MAEPIKIAISKSDERDRRKYSSFDRFCRKSIETAGRNHRIRRKINLMLSLVVFSLFMGSFFYFFYGMGLTGKAISEMPGMETLSNFEINFSSFSVEAFHQGLSGKSDENESARFTMTDQQPGNKNASSSSYSASIGWFSEANVTINLAPAIESVSISSSVNPTESSYTNVSFSFVVYDSNGVSDINSSSARANFTKEGQSVKLANCANISNLDENRVNFSCSILMWYYDKAGAWNVTAYVADMEMLSAQNRTASFSYADLLAMVISPGSISWGEIVPGAADTMALQPTKVNNTGNSDISNLNLKGYNLSGVSYPSYIIYAENFTASPDSNACSGIPLIEGYDVYIPGTSINAGQGSSIPLYYCLKKIPSSLVKQSYSSGSNPWYIGATALLAVMSLGRKRKREELIEKSLDSLRRQGIGIEEVASFVNQKKKEETIEVPVSIFSSENMGPVESIVRYLKEEKAMRFSEIARKLRRDDRTIWKEYSISTSSGKRLNISESCISIPLMIFGERKMSILENLVMHLRKEGMSNAEISRLLAKDPRNIYTLYARARCKMREVV